MDRGEGEDSNDRDLPGEVRSGRPGAPDGLRGDPPFAPSAGPGAEGDLADLVPACIWQADPSGRVLRVNRAFADRAGLSLDALRGDHWTTAVHPDDRARVRAAWDAASTGADALRIAFRLGSGSTSAGAWLTGHLAPLRDAAGAIAGWAGTAVPHGASAIDGASGGLPGSARLSDEVAALLDLIPIGIGIAHDPRADSITVNTYLARLLGIPRAANASLTAPPGERPTSYRVRQDGREVPADDLPLQRAAREGVEIRDLDLEIVRDEDGQIVQMLLSAVPLFDDAGRPRGAIGAFVDVTDRTKAAETLRRLNQQPVAATSEARELAAKAEEARREAQEAARLREELVISISHDLKNPLTTIQGFAQMSLRRLRQGGTEDLEVIAGGLLTIDQTVHRMTDLIEDLLEAARRRPVPGQSVSIRRRPTDLIGLLDEIVLRHSQATDRHQIELTTDRPILVAMLDGVLIERLLTNLIGNAIKYSPAGGRIEVTLHREDGVPVDWAILRVRDQGIGIPAVDLPHVFDRYRRGSNVPDQVAGTGIGLASVREIVQLHGGAIEVASEEGSGSTFTVRLPLPSA